LKEKTKGKALITARGDDEEGKGEKSERGG
jgi:hypothetical protein